MGQPSMVSEEKMMFVRIMIDPARQGLSFRSLEAWAISLIIRQHQGFQFDNELGIALAKYVLGRTLLARTLMQKR